MEENTQKNTQKKESPFAFIRSVLLTVFVTWFVLNFIIINANIPSGSMEKHHHDRRPGHRHTAD